LYTLNQILWTTLLGGPFAGVFMIADNFNTLGEPSKKRQVLITGFVLCLAVVLIGIYIGNHSPNSSGVVYAGILAGAISLVAKSMQETKINEYFKNGGVKKTNWSCLRLAIIFLICTLTLGYGLAYSLIGKSMPTSAELSETDGGFVTIDDFPELVAAIQKTGQNGAFWVVLVPRTAGNDELAANLQYSIEDGALGLDWVLIAQRNMREKNKFLQVIKDAGSHADLKEGNGVQYLRVVDNKNLAEIGQAVLKQLFGTTSSQKLKLIITDFKWKKKV
jgi:uncharacterized membrane protein YiaA